MAVKGYFYHVTDNTRWGSSVLLKPRITNRCDQDEPSVPRICVCPTVAGCFIAACPTQGYRIVYRTQKRVHAVEPYRVYDAKVTGELWLIEPTEFVLVHEFSAEDVLKFPAGFREYSRTASMLNSQRAARSRFGRYFESIKNELPRAQWS